MNYNIFFVSDHHFGHESCYSKFTLSDGITPLRPFKDASHGDEVMIERHNSVVRPNDRVYFLGDVAINHKYLDKVSRMNGRKVLIKGNHDIFPLNKYIDLFDDIRGSHQFDGILLTHIPVHPASLARWGFNVHGHLHAGRVRTEDGHVDDRYFCASVEQINYTPISLEQVKKFKPAIDLPKRKK